MSRKLNANIEKQLRRIDGREQRISDQYYARDAQIRQNYNISDDADFGDYENYTDDMWNYCATSEQHYAEYEYEIRRMNAARAAKMLIGYNIAHRGKKLHQSTIIKRAQKLGADGEFIINQMHASQSISRIVNAHPYLHSELHKYGVTLLDRNHLNFVMTRLSNLYHERDESGYISLEHARLLGKRINKQEKTLSLFHATLRNQYLVRHAAIENQRDMPF